jgi:predicted TPR repeat methyltransferase
MSQTTGPAQHDSYADDYDNQVKAYDCYIGDVLFGLCYEFTQPGMKLLDAGIGSGLSAAPFAKAGLEVFGMDFSQAMLEICRTKGFVIDMKQHDLQQVPWPYPTGTFDILVCCGVMHFISDLEGIFSETGRVLQKPGLFAFTTRFSPDLENDPQEFVQQNIGGFDIYSHAPRHVNSLLQKHEFQRLKMQKCFVGEDIFTLWVVQTLKKTS